MEITTTETGDVSVLDIQGHLDTNTSPEAEAAINALIEAGTTKILINLATLNYQHMTEIQAQSLPLILDGKDVIAQAKTGSGKTAAFGLGVLQALQVEKFRIQSLILCPTRELCSQTARFAALFSRVSFFIF